MESTVVQEQLSCDSASIHCISDKHITALFKGLKATNGWQDDGTGVLLQVVQHPTD